MKRYLLTGTVCAQFLFGLSVQAADAQPQARGVLQPEIRAVQFDVSPALRDIAPLPVPRADNRGGLMVDPEGAVPDSDGKIQYGPQTPDQVVQTSVNPRGSIPAPIASFDGPANLSGVAPPDPVGDIGPNHYVAMSNLFFEIYDRSGVSVFGPAANNTLWSGFGGPCEAQNAGDPIVLYDQLADRWLLTQFTNTGSEEFNCVALSTSPDPTGTYFRWAFSNGTRFPDYPKYGVGADAYFISTRDFDPGYVGIGAFALNRTEMIAGNPTPRVVSFFIDRSNQSIVGDGLLPMDIDGLDLPPAGSAHYFLGTMDDGGPYSAPQDAILVWSFVVDFDTPGNSSFVLSDTVPIADFDTIFPCPGGGRSCIPQPDTSNRLDIQSYRQRPLHRLSYRNFGTHESLVTNQSVEAAPSVAGIRWWELRSPGSSPVIHQEGTYAPGVTDGIDRWMGSAAMDSAGNIALGYSASSATLFPSLHYTGRLVSDPLGTLPQGEGIIFTGTGSQTGGASRWGDYSSLNVDPIDDCTFWYTTEYVPTTSERDWRLRIGAFRFNECGTPGLTISSTSPASQSICVADPASFDLSIGSVASFDSPTTLSLSGNPAPSIAAFTPNPIATLPGTTNLQITNTDTLAAGSYPLVATASAAGAVDRSVNLELIVADTVPSQVTLISPANSEVDVDSRPSFEWGDLGADSYLLEISETDDFSAIVVSQSVDSTTVVPSMNLDANRTYYWRVTAQNACGDGAMSETFEFTTVNQICIDPGLAIPDNNVVGIDSLLSVGTSAGLVGLDVLTQISHTWVGDLVITLSHNGTTVVLMDRPGVPGTTNGCNADDVDATFDDDSAIPVEDVCDANPAIGGILMPQEALSAFAGAELQGDWILNVSDRVGSDTGTIDRWCLLPALDPALVFSDGFED